MGKIDHSEIRKQQILEAADRVLTAGGMENFTIDRVVEEAEIAKGTIYNYFRSRDELIAEMSLRTVALLHQKFAQAVAAEENTLEKLKAICWANYTVYLDSPERYKLQFLIERPEFNYKTDQMVSISSSLQKFMYDLVAEGQRNKEIKTTINPVVICSIIWAGSVAVVQFIENKQRLLQDQEGVTVEDLVAGFAEMITEGLKP